MSPHSCSPSSVLSVLGLRPEPDVAEDDGEPVVEAAYPVQGKNGANRQGPTPLLLTAVLHLDVDEKM
jgi:hypothetical protein